MLGYKIKDVQKVAFELGMDIYTDKKEYLWFLKQALQSLMPVNWKKEHLKGKTYYHNELTSITTEKHPLIYRFRAIFNRLVTN
jgi:hypothetical protein